MPPSADELIQKAQDQRLRGRHHEAAVTAQKAVDEDEENPNGWWQLGLAQYGLSELDEALAAFDRLTDLAPDFAQGWAYYGLTLDRLNPTDQVAEFALERAMELDTKNIEALLALRKLYERSSDKDGDYKVLKRLDELGGLTGTCLVNRLGNYHLNAKRYHDALHAYWRSAAYLEHGSSLYNAGLVYSNSEMSQDADAIDAWRLCQRRHPEYALPAARIAALLPRLLKLAQDVAAVGSTLLPREAWFGIYINPFELLGIEPEANLDDVDAKVIQRRKKALLAEIELEEGRVSWLDGLVIDRSRAIAVCEELNDNAKRENHWTVFSEPNLLKFLTRGEHALFTVNAQYSPLDTLEQIQDESSPLGAWISEIFARQYDAVLGKAIEGRHIVLGNVIEGRHVPIVECLFDGRRWVRPEHSERCFESARRQLALLLKPLHGIRDEASKRKPSKFALVALLRQNAIPELLNLLPSQFRDTQNEVVGLIRSISIDVHNEHNDSDLALELLEVCKKFKFKSPTLNAQLENDLQKLQEIIKEQRKHEAHLTSGKAEWKITKDGVRLGDRHFPLDTISSVRWGVLVSQDTHDYVIAFCDATGNEIGFSWKAQKLQAESNSKHFGTLLEATFAYILPEVVQKVQLLLESGNTVEIGPCRVSVRGVEFDRKGWFSSSACLIPWSCLAADIENGDLILWNTQNQKHRVQMELRSTRNAPVLHFIAKSNS